MLFLVFLVILAIFLLILYAFINRPQKIIVADAGPTQSLTSKEQKAKTQYLPYQIISTSHGKIIDTHKYYRVLVDGKCMEPRGIKDKSQILVEPLTKEQKKYFRKYVKLENVLLIYLKDKDVYKLRILQNYDSLEQLITYRYLSNGEKHRSSRNHRPEDVVGIVKYVM